MHTQLEQIYKTYFHDVYRYALSLCQNESQAQDLAHGCFVYAATASLISSVKKSAGVQWRWCMHRISCQQGRMVPP